jgi:hypothetical protein
MLSTKETFISKLSKDEIMNLFKWKRGRGQNRTKCPTKGTGWIFQPVPLVGHFVRFCPRPQSWLFSLFII